MVKKHPATFYTEPSRLPDAFSLWDTWEMGTDMWSDAHMPELVVYLFGSHEGMFSTGVEGAYATSFVS